ncbi:signal recognition particle-docking protein FtsY [Nitrospiraceae bacterium HYJII51-Mn-bac16s-1-B09]|uniref:Signal recognition particle receptor FtsY n=2 Tax=Candidatus Manganitrophus noduliformans TaxID=2606439 RepID=A0A7X6IC09_9BACT|nr:signal recognition particle-docking protein FtsY [Candidatus Manganitrophus noduliformans]
MAEGFWGKLGKGLAKTREYLSSGLEAVFLDQPNINQETLDRLEELLIGSDLGMEVTDRLMIGLRASVERKEISNLASLKKKLKSYLVVILNKGVPQEPPKTTPVVSLFVGVNGVGKTTTIAKRAAQLRREGKTVLLAAADTFRAAAGEQLAIWGDRVGAEVVRHQEGADPAAVAFDAVSAALARKIDAVLIDTAGRLQTKSNLMEELKKIKRVIAKAIPDAPHERILVLDATTGQNALSQARLFHETIGVTGIILTKLDGTAKGGIIVPIVEALSVPVTYVGVGEGVDDLIPFNIESFAEGLFESGKE